MTPPSLRAARVKILEYWWVIDKTGRTKRALLYFGALVLLKSTYYKTASSTLSSADLIKKSSSLAYHERPLSSIADSIIHFQRKSNVKMSNLLCVIYSWMPFQLRNLNHNRMKCHWISKIHFQLVSCGWTIEETKSWLVFVLQRYTVYSCFWIMRIFWATQHCDNMT